MLITLVMAIAIILVFLGVFVVIACIPNEYTNFFTIVGVLIFMFMFIHQARQTGCVEYESILHDGGKGWYVEDSFFCQDIEIDASGKIIND